MFVAVIDFLSRVTLESPWPTAVVLGVLWAVVHTAGQRLQESRLRSGLRLGGAAVLLAAVGVVVLGYMVDTPRERVASATRALVAATGPFDASAFDALVDPGAALLGPGGDVWAELPAVRRQLEHWATPADTEQKVLGLTVDLAESTGDPDDAERADGVDGAGNAARGSGEVRAAGGEATARAFVNLRTRGATTSGVPVFTTWEITWRRGAAGRWTATAFRWVRFNQQPPPRSLMPS